MKSVIYAAAFVLPLLIGSAAKYRGEPAPETAFLDHVDCHGAEPGVDVAIEVLASERTEKGEDLALHAEVHNHFERAANTMLAYELVDDRGRSIRAPKKLKAARVSKQERRVVPLSVGAGLAPGFYQLRVTAAGVEDETNADAVAIDSLFLKVGDDGVVPISHDEFHLTSNANLVTMEKEVVK
jgi:hypothetical protein